MIRKSLLSCIAIASACDLSPVATQEGVSIGRGIAPSVIADQNRQGEVDNLPPSEVLASLHAIAPGMLKTDRGMSKERKAEIVRKKLVRAIVQHAFNTYAGISADEITGRGQFGALTAGLSKLEDEAADIMEEITAEVVETVANCRKSARWNLTFNFGTGDNFKGQWPIDAVRTYLGQRETKAEQEAMYSHPEAPVARPDNSL